MVATAKRVRNLDSARVQEAWAEVAAARRDFDEAFAIIDRGAGEQAHWIARVLVDEAFEQLRRDPRWAALRDKIVKSRPLDRLDK